MKFKYIFIIIFFSVFLNIYFYIQSLNKTISNERSINIELEYRLEQYKLKQQSPIDKYYSIEYNADSTELLININEPNKFFKINFSSDSSQLYVVSFEPPIIHEDSYGYGKFLKK
jgi:hypothetical protein